MRLMAQGTHRSLHRALARWSGAFALLLVANVARAQSGSSVTDTIGVANRASVTYIDAEGRSGSAIAQASIGVRRHFSVQLTGSASAVIRPGERLALAYVVTNDGTIADSYSLTATAPAGWTAAVYLDADGDGALSVGDTPATTSLSLAPAASAPVLLVITAPPGAADAAVIQATIGASSVAKATVLATAPATLTVHRPQASVTVGLSVNKADATNGDTLRYVIAWANGGEAATAAATLTDTLPAGVRYVPNSLTIPSGASQATAAVTVANGTVQRDANGRDILTLSLGEITSGSSGQVQVSGVVGADMSPGIVTDRAFLSYGDTVVPSPVTSTRIAVAAMGIEKTVVGSDTVQLGGRLTYRIRFTNLSPLLTIYSPVITDTLPSELAFVSADNTPEVAGQVVRWRLATLAPGQSGDVLLVTRPIAIPPDGAGVVNRVTARAANAVAVSATAVKIVVADLTGSVLEIRKVAGVLEAGLGEAVPYTVTLHNHGLTPLGRLVVHDRLPAGMRLASSGMAGVDSSRVTGDQLTLFLSGTITPDGTRSARYALVLSSPGRATRLANRAIAEAEDGLVLTDTAVAWIRVRRGFEAQSQTVVGKVWFDRNDNGHQEPGEPGVAGVRVWSADGEVVTTDREGRYSFRDVRPGSHGFRVDTVGVPAPMRLARDQDELIVVRTDGWTTPRVNFRLAPRSDGDGTPCGCPASTTAVPAGRRDTLLAVVARPTVAPLRSADDRVADVRRDAVAGPGVRLTSPADGDVFGTNRVYVGVRGEPGATVGLLVDDSLVAQSALRPDGIQDFVGVNLTSGPHRVRVWMRNSWGQVRWDSIRVHHSGDPQSIAIGGVPGSVRVDASGTEPLRARVLDAWGVPVPAGTAVTVDARGAVADIPDADPSSTGLQVRTNGDGWVEIPVRGGKDVATAQVTLTAMRATAAASFPVTPSIRPLIVTGIGQLGVGAATQSFGAVTARGVLAHETAVTVSYDSRRAPDDELFARDLDPLESSRYPTLGDGSERRTESSHRGRLSARVEQGFDWLEVGDVETKGFATPDGLLNYRRALSGASAHLTRGRVTWNGFGSVTTQALEERQLRGDGGSGPYLLGTGIRPGTERVAIEVRARENAARLVSRQDLIRFVDYDVDYTSGVILLRRPIPAADAFGNSVFLVAQVERAGGQSRVVGGVRAEVDLLGARAAGRDSAIVGIAAVRDGASRTAASMAAGDLVGFDVRLRRAGLAASAEVLRGTRGDSTATAARVDAEWLTRDDRVGLTGGFRTIGRGFGTTFDPRLSSALTEARAGARMRLGQDTRLTLQHERQDFKQYDVQRQSTTLRAEERLLDRIVAQEFGLTSDQTHQGGVSRSSSTVVARVMMSASEDMDVWVDGSRALSGFGVPARPDRLGSGFSYRLARGVRLEGSQQWLRYTDGQPGAAVSSMTLHTESFFGSRLWGGLERASAARAAHSAVLGWDQRLALGHGWAFQTGFERRVGVSRAPVADPVRALPFAQMEQDRWSASAGLDWLPGADRSRASLHGERYVGADRTGYRFELAGDAALGADAALLTRHDWTYSRRPAATGDVLSRMDRSIVGFAMRPARSDVLNMLAKLEWRRTMNPSGGASLADSLDQQRLIGALDAIWSPTNALEISGRYAMRWARSGIPGQAAASPFAQYFGVRADRRLNRRLSVRIDTRALVEQESHAAAWNAAPSVLLHLDEHVYVEGGWRAGNLRDLDFGAEGGTGAFGTLGVRFTETALAKPAAFWRERMSDAH